MGQYPPYARDIIQYILKETEVPPTDAEVYSCLKAVNKTFRLDQQEDAHELLIPMLEYRGTISDFCLINTSVFKKCSVCSWTSEIRDDPASVFSIRPSFFTNPSSVQFFLDTKVNLPSNVLAYKEDDILEGFFCQNCPTPKRKRDVDTATTMEGYIVFDVGSQPIVIFHLQLFATAGGEIVGATKKKKFRKLKLSPPSYTTNLSISIRNVKYDLINVIFHNGKTIESGHFTNISRMSHGRSNDHIWYVLNDDRIPEPITDAESIIADPHARREHPVLSKLGDPYILAYVQADSLKKTIGNKQAGR